MKHQDVTNKPGENAIFIVFGLNAGDESIKNVKELCGTFAAMVKSMRNRFPEAEASAVIGFGAKAWPVLFPEIPCPEELEEFKEIKGEKHTAVSTPGDLFFHIRAKRMDVCYELASIISNSLHGVVEHVDEVHGFRYFDGRAIIGFVDGTENPDSDEAYSYATIGDEDPFFKGGSYAFAQKYIHDMEKWNNLTTEEQEKVVGRRKYNDLELSDEEKPENAHNAVTNIKGEDGSELKIVRANMAFANPSKSEFGTYFIGYANTFTTTRRMLENMFIGEPIGNSDRLLEFSIAKTGTLFFVPTFDLLDTLAEA